MTDMSAFLEDFGSMPTLGASVLHSEDELESERLESFDKGYRAGWDDALKAKSDDASALASSFVQNLQDLSFTYHEAHAQVLTNLRPLFDEILQKMLPTLARDTLGTHIAEQLSKTASEMGTVQVSIVVAPGMEPEVTQLLQSSDTALPVSVKASASVGPGQAELHLGGKELSIDLAAITTHITEAVHAALHMETVEYGHG